MEGGASFGHSSTSTLPTSTPPPPPSAFSSRLRHLPEYRGCPRGSVADGGDPRNRRSRAKWNMAANRMARTPATRAATYVLSPPADVDESGEYGGEANGGLLGGGDIGSSGRGKTGESTT